MIGHISIKTKMGWITAYEEKGEIFKIKFGKLRKYSKSKILLLFKKKLLKFFNKKTKIIAIPHKIKGDKNQKKVWHEIKKIKYGKTKSYKQIAKKVKLHPRYVGKICSQNKLLLIIPCHRVIRTDGTLGGFSANGGLKLKRKLIQFEKI